MGRYMITHDRGPCKKRKDAKTDRQGGEGHVTMEKESGLRVLPRVSLRFS